MQGEVWRRREHLRPSQGQICLSVISNERLDAFAIYPQHLPSTSSSILGREVDGELSLPKPGLPPENNPGKLSMVTCSCKMRMQLFCIFWSRQEVWTDLVSKQGSIVEHDMSFPGFNVMAIGSNTGSSARALTRVRYHDTSGHEVSWSGQCTTKTSQVGTAMNFAIACSCCKGADPVQPDEADVDEAP